MDLAANESIGRCDRAEAPFRRAHLVVCAIFAISAGGLLVARIKYSRDDGMGQVNHVDMMERSVISSRVRARRMSPLDLDQDFNAEAVIARADDVPIFDFAIVGFPKCATTFLQSYFSKWVPQVYMPQKELCDFLNHTTPHEVVAKFYDPYELCGDDETCGIDKDETPLERISFLHEAKNAEIAQAKVRGFKCPRVLETRGTMNALAPFFHNTNYIVQMRHPVHWFESYYNYRSHKLYPEMLLAPAELIGPCDLNSFPYITDGPGVPQVRNVCTDRAKYHHALSRMGLTPMTSEREKQLLNHEMSTHHLNGKLFLVEIGQLGTENETRADLFRNDLQQFLGLESKLPPFPSQGSSKKVSQATGSAAKRINICDDEHKVVRTVLMQHGNEASTWIREFLMDSPNVVVSSKEFFLERLKTWEADPCESQGE